MMSPSTDVTEKFTTIGIWGPNARETLKKVVADPAGLDIENFPFAAIKPIEIAGKTVSAFRLSYVGEQGWELHMKYEDGLAVWDALRSTGRDAGRRRDLCQFAPDGKEPAPAERRSLTQYNLIESDLARPKVKEADFRGKAKHLEYKAREHQPAMLCTLVMTDNVDAKGVARYPVGILPVMDPGNRRDACRRARPPFLHDLDRLRADHRQEHRAGLSALGLLPGGAQAQRRIFQRDLSGRSGGGRLQAAVRSGEPQAAELIASALRQ
jgi:glycine cleavage system aminomethyltransferase T